MDADQSETTTPEQPTGEPVRAGGMAEKVIGHEVHFGPGIAGSVNAEERVEMAQAAAVLASSRKDMAINYGGALVTAAGSNMEINNGGGQVVVAGSNVEITNGGAQMVVAGGSATIRHGVAVFLLTRSANIEEGSRVIFNTPQAIAFGAVAGAVYALVRILFGKRK